MEVSRSGYYAFRRRPKSPGSIENDNLLVDIRRLFTEHRQAYGSPRVYNALKREGIPCSLNRVARLMHRAGLVAVQRRKFRATTDSGHNWPVAANLLERGFTIGQPNKVWVSDITYIWTREGWLYLSFVLDLYSRGIIGLAMKENMTDELTRSALNQALMRRRPLAGLIHHSDRGSQYASGDYQELLSIYKIVPSMSRKGDCWDNAVAESFLHTLKVELVHRHRFNMRDEAKQLIFEYIEAYYNRKRAH